MAQAPIYVLSNWSCGVVVWPHGKPDSAATFIQRLNEAAETAFEFWGYDVPVVAPEMSDETHVLRIFDPSIDEERVILPLLWNGRVISPVVVFAFRDEIAMRTALGRTDLFGALWCSFPMSQGFPDAESWIHGIGSSSRNMICPWLTPMSTLIHEDAHWFTVEWCRLRDVSFNALPNYIVEGMAEITCSSIEDANDAVVKRMMAISWASRHCLPQHIEGVMRYPVGESLVAYLIETLGISGFLDTLTSWSRSSQDAARQYQSGWRLSLGLAPDCPD